MAAISERRQRCKRSWTSVSTASHNREAPLALLVPVCCESGKRGWLVAGVRWRSVLAVMSSSKQQAECIKPLGKPRFDESLCLSVRQYAAVEPAICTTSLLQQMAHDGRQHCSKHQQASQRLRLSLTTGTTKLVHRIQMHAIWQLSHINRQLPFS